MMATWQDIISNSRNYNNVFILYYTFIIPLYLFRTLIAALVLGVVP